MKNYWSEIDVTWCQCHPPLCERCRLVTQQTLRRRAHITQTGGVRSMLDAHRLCGTHQTHWEPKL